MIRLPKRKQAKNVKDSRYPEVELEEKSMEKGGMKQSRQAANWNPAREPRRNDADDVTGQLNARMDQHLSSTKVFNDALKVLRKNRTQ